MRRTELATSCRWRRRDHGDAAVVVIGDLYREWCRSKRFAISSRRVPIQDASYSSRAKEPKK